MKRIAAFGRRARGIKELEPRVFVVDDDQSVRTSLANLLATEGYAVEVFVSAAEYLARVPHPGPACLVLDVQLPGLDGLALQRQLTEEGRATRKTARPPRTPGIAPRYHIQLRRGMG